MIKTTNVSHASVYMDCYRHLHYLRRCSIVGRLVLGVVAAIFSTSAYGLAIITVVNSSSCTVTPDVANAFGISFASIAFGAIEPGKSKTVTANTTGNYIRFRQQPDPTKPFSVDQKVDYPSGGADLIATFTVQPALAQCTPTTPDDESADDECSEKCDRCQGMPVWNVSEPHTSLWVHDEPLGYQPAIGPRVSLKLSHKQRGTESGMVTTFFGVGRKWNFPWLSFVEQDTGGNKIVHFGSGQTLWMSGNPDYFKNRTITGDTNTGYTLTHADGSSDVFGFVVTNTTGRFYYSFLTEQRNAQGDKTHFYYDGYGSNNLPTIRLLYVVDGDNRTNTIYYAVTNANWPNLVSHVVDAFGRTNSYGYDVDGRMTNIVDVAGLASSFTYDTNDWITSMTTPYGTTSFDYTDTASGNTPPHGRSVRITEPDGGTQLYLHQDNATGVASSYSSGSVPATSPFSNTFDNSNLNLRNSFYWGQRQYPSLTTTNIASFTSDDFRKARMRHFLKSSTVGIKGTVSLEREPSPDAAGTIAGQMTWHDHAGKTNSNYYGTQSSPLFVAQVLPDGTTRFTRTERNSLGAVTNEFSTFSVTVGGSVLLRTNRYTYAADGIDLITMTNALGIQTSSNVFNAYHQVLTNYNALGEVTIYTYNANQQLTSMRPPAGLTTTNLYFTSGTYSNWLDRTIDLEIARTNSFTYTNGLVFTRTDERGLTVTNTYDALQRLTRMSFPDDTFITNSYDKLDLVRTVDRMGFTNSFGYDTLRRRVAETNALGYFTLFDYCNCGSLNSIRDAAGNYTYFFYDNLGRATNTVAADGYAVTNRYNLLGQLTSVIDSAGTSVTNWFNNQGLSVTSSNAFGRLNLVLNDALDRATNSVDANGVTVTNTYDNLNRLLTRGYADGGVEKFGYTFNTSGMTSYTNQLNNVTRYVHDAASRKTAETNANLEVTQFGYNAAGDLLTLTDGKNQVTTWNYDGFGRVTNKVAAASTEIFRYAYDPNNRLTNRWTPAKGAAVYRYDVGGNLTNIDYAVSSDIALQYDSLNRLTNMVDAVGTNRYTYTSAGQLLSEDGPWSDDTVSYTYNNRLRAILSLLQPSTSAWTNGYSYDAMKRLTNLNSQAGSFCYLYANVTQGISPASLVRKLTLPNSGYITNHYDSNARLLFTKLNNSSHTALSSHSYDYNVGNERTKQTRTDGSYVDYTYDGTSQLKTTKGKESGGATNRLQEQFGYTYDAAGNLNYRTNNAFVQTFNVNTLNELTMLTRSGTLTVAGATSTAATNVTVNALAATRYTDKTWAKDGFPIVDNTTNFTAIAKNSIDLADTNMVTVDLRATNMFVYDANGNLRTNGAEVLEYDDDSRLVTNYVASVWKCEFVYDGKNRRRIQRDYSWSGGWIKTNETRLVYDGNLPLQHRDSSNAPTLTLTRGLDLSISFEGAGGIGGLLAMTESSGVCSFYHADGNGNVTCLANTNQLIVAKYLYDSFGNTLAINGPKSSVNPYRFTSKPVNTASGKYDYLYRWYSPTLQRWLNQDPQGEQGGINLYNFVENDPVLLFDSFGFSPGSPPSFPKDAQSCCPDSEIQKGQAELNNRFGSAKMKLSELGIKPVRSGKRGASCKNSSADILRWLAPFPKCWQCYLELREYAILGKRWSDHQVIICEAYSDGQKKKEIMFDWWGDTMNNVSCSGGTPDPFRKEYPDNPWVVRDRYDQCTTGCNGKPAHPELPGFPASGKPPFSASTE